MKVKDFPEYVNYKCMKKRCNYPSTDGYANYGGRGITVCDEWQKDFRSFFNHIGSKPSPKHTIDRINNDKGYEPGNVRWATPKEQGRNRRHNVEPKKTKQLSKQPELISKIISDYKTGAYSQADLAKKYGFSPKTIYRHLNKA